MGRKRGGEEPPSEDPAIGEPAVETVPQSAGGGDAPASAETPFEERLPWLQRVEEDEPPERRSVGKPLGYALGLLLLIGALFGGLSLFQREPASPGPDPVEEQIASSASVDPFAVEGNKAVDRPAPAKAKQPPRDQARAKPSEPAAKKEEPARKASQPAVAVESRPAKPAAPAAVSPRAVKKPAAVAARREAPPAPARPRADPPLSGPLLQLGAYDSAAGAEREWRTKFGPRFRGARHSVERARVGGRIFYRLRVEVPQARGRCRAYALGSRSCFEVRSGR